MRVLVLSDTHRHLEQDVYKRQGICRGIGSGRAADGRLIDIDHFIDFLQAKNLFVLAGAVFGAVELPCSRLEQDLVYKRRFAAPGNACHSSDHPNGKFRVDIFQIIF